MSLTLFDFAGKRPRDLLNLKAKNFIQSVFSLKDAISDKESHEISALFGITMTHVYISPLSVSFLFCIYAL
jgi:hypothetical protein